jgi:hypothetical protein
MFRDVVVADIELGSQIAIDTARYIIPNSELSIHSTYKRRIIQDKYRPLEISRLLRLYEQIHNHYTAPEDHYVRFVRYKVYKVLSTIFTYETRTDLGPVRIHIVTA